MRFLLLLFLCLKLLANNFYLKPYKIPYTNATIDIPEHWSPCINTPNAVRFCGKNMQLILDITTHKHKTAKDLYDQKLVELKYYGIHIYGNQKVNDALWLDYEMTRDEHAKIRFFSAFIDLPEQKALSITYTLIGQRISGYTLLRFQKSLLSLKLGA